MIGSLIRMSFVPPPPDLHKLQTAWEEWERGEQPPGKVLANLKTAGMADRACATGRQWLEPRCIVRRGAVVAASASRDPTVGRYGDAAPWADRVRALPAADVVAAIAARPASEPRCTGRHAAIVGGAGRRSPTGPTAPRSC